MAQDGNAIWEGCKIKKARKQSIYGLLISFDIDFSGAAGSYIEHLSGLLSFIQTLKVS
jgi:hypothetical protein